MVSTDLREMFRVTSNYIQKKRTEKVPKIVPQELENKKKNKT